MTIAARVHPFDRGFTLPFYLFSLSRIFLEISFVSVLGSAFLFLVRVSPLSGLSSKKRAGGNGIVSFLL